VACSRGTTGISEWEAVVDAANATILEGDTDRFMRSLDATGIPPEKVDLLTDHFRSKWKGIPHHMKLISTKVVSADEAEEMKTRRRKDWPEEMQRNSTRWGVPPDKVIVYEFSGDESLQVWSIGVFPKDGAWFFTAAY
jgi:hypothetical protein